MWSTVFITIHDLEDIAAGKASYFDPYHDHKRSSEMWGNLAGRLGATDINATLEKIGNAVAPREEGDDEYYDDDDISEGDYDDDEEYEEEYGLGDGKEIMKKVASASPFRLAGMLTQALDNRPGGENNDDFHANDDAAINSKVLFERESIDENESGGDDLVDDSKRISDNFREADIIGGVPSQLPVTTTYESLDERSKNVNVSDNMLEFNGISSRKTIETLSKDIAPAAERDISLTEIELEAKVVTSTIQGETVRKDPTETNALDVQKPSDLKGYRDAQENVVNIVDNAREEVDDKEQGLEVGANVNSKIDTKNNQNDVKATMKVNPEVTAFMPTKAVGKKVVPVTDRSNNETSTRVPDSANGMEKLSEAESKCQELQKKLLEAENTIEALTKQAKCDKEKAQSEKDNLITQFHSKEARLLQATSEENQNQTLLLEQEYAAKIQNLEITLANERKESQEQHAEYKRLLRESYSNVDRIEKEFKTTISKHEKDIAQVQQREERALRKVDDRMAQTMAVLDERDEEIKNLRKAIKSMESKVNEHQEGEEEAEEELEEIHQENESLRQTIEELELEKNNLKDQVAKLKSGSEELPALQMELTMLREERNRERTKNQAVMDSAMSSRTQLETERDNALSELRDSKQQLAATLGDLEISRADYARIIMANDNLQSALEAFQDERRAEMEMIDEQRRESEEALKSAHATATNAMKQIHANEMHEVQKASDNAVKNVMHEMDLVEGNLEKLKSENNQMRRSLDEAIHRLQTTQEDVIDRNVMKNILLDWCTLNEQNKRHQVLQVMANLLHFSEEEKEKVHLTSKSLDSVRAKVVGALAAPLPPSKADVEHLEGSNVREKWVNFLMAETDDI